MEVTKYFIRLSIVAAVVFILSIFVLSNTQLTFARLKEDIVSNYINSSLRHYSVKDKSLYLKTSSLDLIAPTNTSKQTTSRLPRDWTKISSWATAQSQQLWRDRGSVANVNNPTFNLTYLEVPIKSSIEKLENVSSLLQSPVINAFDISFIVNMSHKCTPPYSPEVVIVVPTARANSHRRKNLRDGNQGSYVNSHADVTHPDGNQGNYVNSRSDVTRPDGNQGNYSNSHADVTRPDSALMLFFIGRAGPEEPQTVTDNLQKEMSEFGDIVVADFRDVYLNILTKHISMLQWVLTFCPNVRYVLRCDDDTVIKPTEMIHALRRHRRTQDNFILGKMMYGGSLRVHRGGKYAVPREQYAADRWPPFLIGRALGFPTSTVRLLLEAARRIPTVWLDDVFITGICASRLGIPIYDERSFHFKHGVE